MSALKYWLWLSGCEVSAKAKAALFRYYGDAQQAFAQATAVYGYYAKAYFASIA